MSTVAIGQFSAGEDKIANLREIEHLAQTAAENEAKILFCRNTACITQK